jgi:hypothetical protein
MPLGLYLGINPWLDPVKCSIFHVVFFILHVINQAIAMKKTILLISGMLLLASLAMSQETKLQTHNVSLNYLAIKDQMNYGLVFRGPGLGYAYSAQWQNPKRILAYEGRFNLSTPLTRGIIAMSVNVVPVRLDYLFKVGPEKKLCIGPYFIAEYNYETYPDLQSIYSFWFTNFSLGGALKYSFSLKDNLFDLSLHTTFLGFTSRQPEIDDPYFGDQSFTYVVKFLHQDLTFGSWGRYNQSELELRWQPKAGSRLAYAYSFQYYGYYDYPNLTMLNQTLKLIILPKKNK